MCGTTSTGIALIEHAISDRRGEGAVRPQRPFVRTGRVHQREVGVNVSLSVMHEYDQQRRTFREAVCEGRARAAAGDGTER